MENSYVWHEQYKAAMLETDPAKLKQRIQAAKSSIDDRLHELVMGHHELVLHFMRLVGDGLRRKI